MITDWVMCPKRTQANLFLSPYGRLPSDMTPGESEPGDIFSPRAPAQSPGAPSKKYINPENEGSLESVDRSNEQ